MYSTKAWCADVANDDNILQIDLGAFRLVSGVGISGNPNADSGITGFTMKSGYAASEMKTLGVGFCMD